MSQLAPVYVRGLVGTGLAGQLGTHPGSLWRVGDQLSEADQERLIAVFSAGTSKRKLAARFLESIGIATFAEPAARFPVQVRSRVTATTGVDELIDFGGLAVLSPRKRSMQFDGWAVADQQGKSASAISRRFLTELCESTGWTGYESLLATLDGGA